MTFLLCGLGRRRTGDGGWDGGGWEPGSGWGNAPCCLVQARRPHHIVTTTPAHRHNNPTRHPASLCGATLAPQPTPAKNLALRMLLLTHPSQKPGTTDALINPPWSTEQNPKSSQGIMGCQVASRLIYLFALQENNLKKLPCSSGCIPACPHATVSHQWVGNGTCYTCWHVFLRCTRREQPRAASTGEKSPIKH